MQQRIRLAGILLAAALALAAPAAPASEPGGGDDAFRAGIFWVSADQPAAGTGTHAGMRERRNRVQAVKLAIALAGAGLLGWGATLRRRGRPHAHRRLRDGLLAGLAVAAFFGWWNFFQFHYPGTVHVHEVFNHYMGSKYFPELSYTRMYQCIAVADAEDGLTERVRQRLMTDLETYALMPARSALADPGGCKSHFAPVRWATFRQDVRAFRSLFAAEGWEALQRDHGYNPTPAWGLLGSAVARLTPVSAAGIHAIALLDWLLDLVMWGCVAWAFGWRTMCVGILYWGTNHAADYSWIGGAFLRDDWLAATLVGICLLRRGRALPAGFLLGWAALIRLFPALALVGIGTSAALQMLRARRVALGAAQRRVALGAALALAIFLPLSSVAAGGASAWREFADNMRLHLDTPGSNSMGLQTLLSFDPAGRLSALLDSSSDPSTAWKESRRAAFARRRLAHGALACGFVALLVWALRRQDPWVATVLGLGALPVLLQPACYYTAVLAAFGLLWTRRESVGVALCLLSALLWLPAALFTETDDIFVASSVPVLLFVVYATAAMGHTRSADET